MQYHYCMMFTQQRPVLRTQWLNMPIGLCGMLTNRIQLSDVINEFWQDRTCLLNSARLFSRPIVCLCVFWMLTVSRDSKRTSSC